MTDTDENLDLWESMKAVDRSFTKPITGKSYKGDSPNPTYMIWKVTRELGPIGRHWGFTVQFDRTREGAPHKEMVEQVVEYASDGQTVLTKRAKWEIIRELHHEVCIRFWFQHGGEIGTFDAYGGTPMLYLSKKGQWVHDEDAAKKSLTDAYTKGLSWLGACADIFLGIFDDKYTSQPEPAATAPAPSAAPEPQAASAPAAAPAADPNRTTTTPADDGWD